MTEHSPPDYIHNHLFCQLAGPQELVAEDAGTDDSKQHEASTRGEPEDAGGFPVRHFLRLQKLWAEAGVRSSHKEGVDTGDEDTDVGKAQPEANVAAAVGAHFGVLRVLDSARAWSPAVASFVPVAQQLEQVSVGSDG